LKKLLACVGIALGAISLIAYLQWFVALDPFASYRRKMRLDPSKEVGVRMKNVRFDIFDDAKKVASCDVERVEIRRDRQLTELFNIRNGKMATDEGNFQFTAAFGTYEQRTRLLSAQQGTRFWNENVDLKTEGFQYYQKVKRLDAEGKVEGKFYGGTIVAEHFEYLPMKEEASAGPVEWTGDLAANLQDVPGIEATKQKPWNVNGKGFIRKGDVQFFKNGWASDGEVILTADLVEHNTKTDVMTATGNVKYFSGRSNMVCEKAVIYRKERRAELTGNVTMLVKPKEQEKLEETTIPPFRPVVPETIAGARPPAPKTADEKKQDDELRQNNARKYPTQIWAEKIEYWYKKGSRHAVVTGSPQARQELPSGRWRHIWTTRAELNVETEWLRLDSAPDKKTTRMKTSLGDDLVAKWLRVSTKEGGEEEMEGEDVSGVVMSDDDDVNSRGGNPPPPSTKPPLKGRIGV
jgi:hypothetical protein